MATTLPRLAAEEAAAMISNSDTIGLSGFTPAGAPKRIPRALAERAKAFHARGEPFTVNIMTGASTGPSVDGVLAEADAIGWRTPYQSNKILRQKINEGKVQFFDMHLSQLPQAVRYGFFGEINWALVEACDVNDKGEITLSTSVGASPTYLHQAKRILIELNRFHPPELHGFHDIYEPADPPLRKAIPIYSVYDRIGRTTVNVDPSKIVGIVETDLPDEAGGFAPTTDCTRRIGENVAHFFAEELQRKRIPEEFLPIQSGVGNIANAVLGALGDDDRIPPFTMYSEVIQDAVIDLIRRERILFASGTSLTVSPSLLLDIYKDLNYFRQRMVLRPQEISNNPEIIRRIGIITINTALEIDLSGNVNSTHVLGTSMMNGIGGSGDFTRNAYLSVFTCPSTAKKGKVSAIVPAVTHADHNEHSVQIVITENGVADLRGKSPTQRAELIIENCAHPDFRESLLGYVHLEKKGHTHQSLEKAFAMHAQLLKTGDMRGVVW
jgi:succinate CoA transferase